MLEIYVDADACPVKDEVYRVAGRYGLRVWVVSNGWLRVPEGPLVTLVVVAEGLWTTPTTGSRSGSSRATWR